jgi:hypothetical protein
MNDAELALLAAALLITVPGWQGDENDNQTADERRLKLAYDAIFDEGARRFGSEEFAAMRDQLMASMQERADWLNREIEIRL